MTLYDINLYVHIVAGTAALASFWTAAALRKGSPRHRAVGAVFLVSMLIVSITGVPITMAAFSQNQMVFGSFLLYLELILATACWLGWRAVRDKRDVKRYAGRVYHVLAWANLIAGAIILVMGVLNQRIILAVVSGVGLATGPLMLRFARQGATDRQWWLRRHYLFMLGAGAGAHVAFLNIGVSRLLPPDFGTTAQRIAFFAPIVLFFIARRYLDRKYIFIPKQGPSNSPTVPN